MFLLRGLGVRIPLYSNTSPPLGHLLLPKSFFAILFLPYPTKDSRRIDAPSPVSLLYGRFNLRYSSCTALTSPKVAESAKVMSPMGSFGFG